MHARHASRAANPRNTRSALVPFILPVFLLLAVLPGAHAEESRISPQVWLNPGFFSWHFDRSKDLRDDNWGVGVEVVLVPEHAVMAGTYINSDEEHSRYAAYQWRPLRWRPYGIDVSAGIALGVFDGYPNVNDGGWFAAPLPLLAVEGRYFGVNFTVVPTIEDKVNGAFVIQIKLRVW
jgi:hypothetical protein